VSLLGEIFIQLLGEAAIDAFRGSRKSPQSFPEGQTNASLGALSAFTATLGFLFALPVSVIAVLQGPTPEFDLNAMFILAALGLIGSFFALVLARRALRVTRRYLGLVRYAVVIALPGLILSVVALVATVVRIFL
jgi:hypothetical protein